MTNTIINGKYELLLPDHRAARPEWKLENGGWEVKRLEEMIAAIKYRSRIPESTGVPVPPIPIVFDIGTEEGDISALLMKYTGCDMVLFEPNERVFPCIRDIWIANNLKMPLDFFHGFLSSKTTIDHHHKSETLFAWVGDQVADHGFKQLYENYPDVPQVTLDDYCKFTGLIPDVITMDVEGAEMEVIKGGLETIAKHKPVIFMSVHPEFMYESYRHEGIWKDKFDERQHVVHMLRLIDELGYTHRCIEYDYHELHMVYEPK